MQLWNNICKMQIQESIKVKIVILNLSIVADMVKLLFLIFCTYTFFIVTFKSAPNQLNYQMMSVSGL